MCRTAHSHVIALVVSYRAGVADNVCGEDRRQFALLTGHVSFPTARPRTLTNTRQLVIEGGCRSDVVPGARTRFGPTAELQSRAVSFLEYFRELQSPGPESFSQPLCSTGAESGVSLAFTRCHWGTAACLFDAFASGLLPGIVKSQDQKVLGGGEATPIGPLGSNSFLQFFSSVVEPNLDGSAVSLSAWRQGTAPFIRCEMRMAWRRGICGPGCRQQMFELDSSSSAPSDPAVQLRVV